MLSKIHRFIQYVNISERGLWSLLVYADFVCLVTFSNQRKGHNNLMATRSASRSPPIEAVVVMETPASQMVSMSTDSSNSQNSSEKVKYMLMPPYKPIPTFWEGTVSASEYIRTVRSAWRNEPCTETSKTDVIIGAITEHTRQLLWLDVPSYSPEEMLNAMLKLHSGENTRHSHYILHDTTN